MQTLNLHNNTSIYNQCVVTILHIDSNKSFSEYEKYLKFLSAEHQNRIFKYRRSEDRIRSMFARLLISYMASSHFGLPIRMIEFEYGKYGKPFLKRNPEFQFSFSHAFDRIALVIDNNSIGIDIELVRSYDGRIAKRIFTHDEQTYLDTFDNREDIFFWIWTRKEAYIKESGMGMSCLLSSFSVLNRRNGFFYSMDVENYIVSVHTKKIFLYPPRLQIINITELINNLFF